VTGLALLLRAAQLVKSQLAFAFQPRQPVAHPGTRGGHFRITPKGDIRYDQAKKAPGRVFLSDAHEVYRNHHLVTDPDGTVHVFAGKPNGEIQTPALGRFPDDEAARRWVDDAIKPTPEQKFSPEHHPVSREALRAAGYVAVQKYTDLHRHGYNIVVWRTAAGTPSNAHVVFEYVPREKDSPLPRRTANADDTALQEKIERSVAFDRNAPPLDPRAEYKRLRAEKARTPRRAVEQMIADLEADPTKDLSWLEGQRVERAGVSAEIAREVGVELDAAANLLGKEWGLTPRKRGPRDFFDIDDQLGAGAQSRRLLILRQALSRLEGRRARILVLKAGRYFLAKAEQLGFAFQARQPVAHPGSRGGHYRFTPRGEVRYDEPPAPKAPPPPATIPVENVRQVRVGPEQLATDAWEGTVADDRPVIAYRGIGDFAELHAPGGWASSGTFTVVPLEGRTTQFATDPHAIARVQKRAPTGAVQSGRAYQYVVEADLRGLPFRALREPAGGHVQADLGLGLGILGAIPLDRIQDVRRVNDDGSLGIHVTMEALTPPEKMAYRQLGTRAPLFKAWFGDWEQDPANASKVVKPTGEPQETYPMPQTPGPRLVPAPPMRGDPVRVFHGTGHGGFSAFDPHEADPGALYGPGFYFTEDRGIAEGYAKGSLHQEMHDQHAQELARFVRKHLPKWERMRRATHMVWGLGVAPNRRHSSYYLESRTYPGNTQAAVQVLGTDFSGPGADLDYLPRRFGWNVDVTYAWKQLARARGWKELSPEVKECYLNIRQPFDADHDRVPVEAIPAEFTTRYRTLGDYASSPERRDKALNYRQLGDMTASRRAVNDILKAAGYDGITHIGGIITGQDRTHRVWIAFDPTQIKAADNVGTFDPSNPDITKSRRGLALLLKAAQLALFRDAADEVQHPGSRGGKGYYDRWGRWQYGEKPKGFQETPEGKPVKSAPGEQNIRLPGEPDLRTYDWILVNISGGKDSQAALDETVKRADAQGVPRSRIVAVHEIMHPVDHPGAAELAGRQAAHYGLRYETVTRTLGNLLEQVERKGKFPGMGNTQFCTSDHKRAQADKLITKLADDVRSPTNPRPRILNVMGLRGDESPERGKQPPYCTLARKGVTNSVKQTDQWLPIHGWTAADAWARIKATGVESAATYKWAERFSCPFCIYGKKEEHIEAARRYPDLAAEYARIEEKIGHTLVRGRTMRQVIAEAERRGILKNLCALHRPMFLKAVAAQYAFGFPHPRRRVLHPGKKGGKWFMTRGGEIRYGLPEVPPMRARADVPSPDEAVVFRSGASDITSMRGYIAAGRAIGVEVNQLSDPAKAVLAEAVLYDHPAFVDSGAFPAFRRGKRLTAAEFDRVLGEYEGLMDRTASHIERPELRGQPQWQRGWYFVMPDVIGDQAESQRLQHAFAPRIRRLIERGAHVLVPLQRGERSLAQVYQDTVENLGTDKFVSALPSNEAAVPPQELLDFVKTAKPRAIHLLGLGKQKLVDAWRERFVEAVANRLIIVTADANRLRSIVGQGRPLTSAVNEEAERVLSDLAYAGHPLPPRARILRMIRPRMRAEALARIERPKAVA
jgi:3'-phosphoadenosine 5'-phosphosulfate sulfotransferase (PAPS reductase)/FAD synthetase